MEQTLYSTVDEQLLTLPEDLIHIPKKSEDPSDLRDKFVENGGMSDFSSLFSHSQFTNENYRKDIRTTCYLLLRSEKVLVEKHSV